MPSDIITAFIIAAGIPSAITGFCFWMIEKKIDQREKRMKEAEETREQNELLLVKVAGASLSLAEATAAAVQRIPDANCNGDMKAALEYANEVKRQHKDFLYEQGIKNILL